ncbi:MAG: iron ABC transporter permease [Nitrospirae bacterium]|jgi:iron complex transport system permease protein|nr:iron ABC transporter permease [Nitrospirota bacterium]
MSKIKFLFLISVLVITFSVSLFLGPRIINPFELNGTDKEILLMIRLPRVIVATLMGMALGASGAVLQGILRNPLADPYILGISSGSALAATLGLLSGMYMFSNFSIPLTAFIGASIVSILVGLFGWKKGGLWPGRLLLAGIGLSFLFYAILMLIISISANEVTRRALLWIFGDLSIAEWSLIPYGFLFILAGLYICISRAKALNALMLGDDFAHSLGFSVHRERLLLFASVAIMTSASVSLGGTIGFIGLIIPHIVRFLAGADNKKLIPLSALCGGAFLCIADMIGRTIMSPAEIPSGIITAIIGSPYFLYLLRKKDVLST